jgi:AraC-like DNA-binding protein
MNTHDLQYLTFILTLLAFLCVAFKKSFNDQIKWLFCLLLCIWLTETASDSIDKQFFLLLILTANIFFVIVPLHSRTRHHEFDKVSFAQPEPNYWLPFLVISFIGAGPYPRNEEHSLTAKSMYRNELFISYDIYLLTYLILIGATLYGIAVIFKKIYGSRFTKIVTEIKPYLEISGKLNSEKVKTEQPHHILLTHERITQIAAIIKEHLETKKPFLQHGYSLKMLSDETHVPLHHLSAFINQYYKMNFNDLINAYRILTCVEKLLRKEWKHKKLEAIANECGFNNRNTFTTAFKKVTELNPSEFLMNIKLGKVKQVVISETEWPHNHRLKIL